MAVAIVPVSLRLTRIAGLGLACVVWLGLIFLTWRRRAIGYGLLGFTVVVIAFLLWPSSPSATANSLRSQYVANLRHYHGTRYYWGGETRLGIDCSGLVRRALIDAFLVDAIRYARPDSARRALSLWWHDCSALALSEEYRGLTLPVTKTRSVNALDHSLILPGDLAVTTNGAHVMAYLGEQRWIEADPEVGRVITVTAPTTENPWFTAPMTIMRWSVLE